MSKTVGLVSAQCDQLMPRQIDQLMPRQITVRETLQNKKDTLTTALADVDAALEALDANPEVSKVLELLARAGARL